MPEPNKAADNGALKKQRVAQQQQQGQRRPTLADVETTRLASLDATVRTLLAANLDHSNVEAGYRDVIAQNDEEARSLMEQAVRLVHENEKLRARVEELEKAQAAAVNTPPVVVEAVEPDPQTTSPGGELCPGAT